MRKFNPLQKSSLFIILEKNDPIFYTSFNACKDRLKQLWTTNCQWSNIIIIKTTQIEWPRSFRWFDANGKSNQYSIDRSLKTILKAPACLQSAGRSLTATIRSTDSISGRKTRGRRKDPVGQQATLEITHLWYNNRSIYTFLFRFSFFSFPLSCIR